jgi:superoxide reductase
MDLKFYKCEVCGNVIEARVSGGGPLACCGKPMKALTPNSSDGAGEKHVPVLDRDGNSVTIKIGSVTHPSTEEHYIMWIYLQTKDGGHFKNLKPGDVPESKFNVEYDDSIIAAYEYCNLHGLWKLDL